ncbi:MAG: hypothetical protein ACRECE_01840 [Xanthobacteraceae bacterium]
MRAIVLAFFAAVLIPGLFLALFFEDFFADLRADFLAVFFDALFFAGLRLVAAFAMIQVPSATSSAWIVPTKGVISVTWLTSRARGMCA